MGDDARPVIVRRAEPRDLEAIRRIQTASESAAQWDPQGYDVSVAEHGSQVAGFIVTRSVAAGEHEILNLAVHPDSRRSGVGAHLLTHAMARDPGDWFLEVRASNRNAIHFYESAGFQVAGVRRGYYSEPQDDAVVMRMGS